ncbi:MAG TPA: type 2 lanthipeptide synthetase LanM family protein [Longimicrobium sp.]|jgi:type 2 lantibiotic biosynthesis protein LanM
MTGHLSPISAAGAPALTLRERLLRMADAPGGGPGDEQRAGEALERWRTALDRGGPDRFARRLRWDGLDEGRLREGLYLAEAEIEAAEWSLLLEEACDAAAHEPTDADPAIDPADPIPFEEVVLPFLHAARRRLADAAPGAGDVLAPAARAALERALLRELSAAANQALQVDFSVALARAGGRAISFGAPRPRVYLGFVESLRAARLRPLVAAYPVLARLLAVRAVLWVSTSAELVARARADAAALAGRFGGGEPGRIVSLRTARGETHCAGRTVAAVGFASGLEVMYKPRSMKVDIAFYGLLEWLREGGLAPDQRILRVLDRGEYGWVEFVRAEPLASAEEVRDYYERAGSLLCLAYLLGAGDLHAENMIAAGAYPVPIDLETLMLGTPVQGAENGGVFDPAVRLSPAAPSVLGTALLPFWQVGADITRLQPGGLGLAGSATVVERGWAFVNTDQMRREERRRPSASPVNVPMLHGEPVSPAGHVDDLVRGFERCYAFISAHREALASPAGPLTSFRGQRVRVLLRDTRIYDSALRASLHPRYLHDGVERGIQLERLRSGALALEVRLPYWAAFAAEQRDLEELDFPYFWCFTDGTALHDSRGDPVGSFCPVSPYQAVRERIARMDAAECHRQSTLVRFIYALAECPPATRAAEAAPAPLDRAMALAEAGQIARALESLVVRAPDGSPSWIGRDGANTASPGALGIIDDRLFDGRAGVALFLGALDAVAGTGHAALAAEALLPLRRALRDPRQRALLAARTGLGAGLGMGGTVYVMGQMGRLTGDATWTDDARLAARAITLEAIASDPVLEVLGGSAGAALALLSLHDLTGDAWLLELAAACGARLAGAARVEPRTGRRVWSPGGAGFTTGFAHGAGGIATALLRLAAATGREEIAAAAEEGFRFEESVAERQPAGAAAQPAGTAAFSWSQTWCNGAVGVALGRVTYGAEPSAAVLRTAAEWEIGAATDHPCCGHLGRAELLFAAGRPERALALAGEVVARARAARTYQISRELPDARVAPAFFQGLSGIGYQLLRLTHPETLPSVLSFR